MTVHSPTPDQDTVEKTVFGAPLSVKLVMLVTSVIGFLAAGQLILERLELFKDANHVTSCDINPILSCGSIMKTWQASLFGFPNPFIGLVSFAVVTTIAAGLFAGARYARWFWIALTVTTTFAVVFLGWLWWQSLYSIGALCIYCMIVWTVTSLLWFRLLAFLPTLWDGAKAKRLATFAASWWWAFEVILLIGIALSIFIRFAHFWLSLLG